MWVDAFGAQDPDIEQRTIFEQKVLMGSELVIAMCYFIIPALIFWYMRGIEVADVFLTVRVWFMLFILCCGITHFLGFLSFWWQITWVITLGKLVTAFVSVATIVVLLQYMFDLDKLMRKAAQLEKDVDASIRQLDSLKMRNEELARLKEEALRIANMRQEFISTVSHEVRTPLQSIIGFGEILEQSELDPSQKQMLCTMMESSRMLCTIINDILDFSKYQKENFALEVEPFSIVGAIVSALRISSSRATAKGVDLRYQVCNRLPGILLGDLTRVVQIVSNLVSNGVKFTEEGNVTVMVSSVASEQEKNAWIEKFNARDNTFTLEDTPDSSEADLPEEIAKCGAGDANLDRASSFKSSRPPHISVQIEPSESSGLLADKSPSPRRHVPLDMEGIATSAVPDATVNRRDWGIRLEVKDTGVGVPKSSFARIFRRFMQSDASTTRIFGGTGLGLSIVQQLTNCMKGSIHLESTMGEGTTFTIFLKLPPQAETPILLPMSSPEVLPPPSISPRASDIDIKPGSLSEIARIGDSSTTSETKEVDPSTSRASANASKASDRKKAPPKAAPDLLCDISRVLLVDDNEINRAVTKPMLHKAGVPNVDTAKNGQQAYERMLAATEPYDAVLLDLHMPVLDGFGAVQKIRLNLRAADAVPIFAFTAASFSTSESAELREKGFSGIVFKPCTIARIRTAMELAAQFKRNEISADDLFSRSESIYTQRTNGDEHATSAPSKALDDEDDYLSDDDNYEDAHHFEVRIELWREDEHGDEFVAGGWLDVSGSDRTQRNETIPLLDTEGEQVTSLYVQISFPSVESKDAENDAEESSTPAVEDTPNDLNALIGDNLLHDICGPWVVTNTHFYYFVPHAVLREAFAETHHGDLHEEDYIEFATDFVRENASHIAVPALPIPDEATAQSLRKVTSEKSTSIAFRLIKLFSTFQQLSAAGALPDQIAEDPFICAHVSLPIGAQVQTWEDLRQRFYFQHYQLRNTSASALQEDIVLLENFACGIQGRAASVTIVNLRSQRKSRLRLLARLENAHLQSPMKNDQAGLPSQIPTALSLHETRYEAFTDLDDFLDPLNLSDAELGIALLQANALWSMPRRSYHTLKDSPECEHR
ncbi:Histidine kinase 3 [Hondaea fermentalgiana]|uniref:Histidine kinase 3 n=1 Tax=Hondaea fermentalgiana TaxID=2315210 RepID=A0A2R5G7N5_9STRA|nr:Histidine kinase 3 [Hondaea fermentalgiana]|eukprot:GBG26555.1 Histidine kinase 3 [Hondaea fermentalgiana]